MLFISHQCPQLCTFLLALDIGQVSMSNVCGQKCLSCQNCQPVSREPGFNEPHDIRPNWSASWLLFGANFWDANFASVLIKLLFEYLHISGEDNVWIYFVPNELSQESLQGNEACPTSQGSGKDWNSLTSKSQNKCKCKDWIF